MKQNIQQRAKYNVQSAECKMPISQSRRDFGHLARTSVQGYSGRSFRFVVAFTLAFFVLVGCGEMSAADHNNQGNDLYSQEIYGQALNEYKEAALLAPDRPEPYVNLGNARYQMKDYLGAIEAPNKVLPTADLATQAIIYYNQGNAHFRMQELDQAIESYKKALRINPDDNDAKYNLELAQQIQEQQQQQQQQAGGEGQQQPQPQQPQPGQDPNQQQPQPGGQQPQQPEQGNGDQQRPEPPPASMTPEEAQRQLDRLRRSEERNNDDLQDNYGVDPNGDSPRGSDNGW